MMHTPSRNQRLSDVRYLERKHLCVSCVEDLHLSATVVAHFLAARRCRELFSRPQPSATNLLSKEIGHGLSAPLSKVTCIFIFCRFCATEGKLCFRAGAGDCKFPNIQAWRGFELQLLLLQDRGPSVLVPSLRRSRSSENSTCCLTSFSAHLNGSRPLPAIIMSVATLAAAAAPPSESVRTAPFPLPLFLSPFE